MKFKKFFWDYLYFTQIERYGIVFLLAFCLAAFTLPPIYSRFFVKHKDASPTAIAVNQPFIVPEPVITPKSFHFNPNTATVEDFKALGLSEKTAKSILNYRTKGGKFRKPADFAKIYTLSKADFERLKPFISLDAPATIPDPDAIPENEPKIIASPPSIALAAFDPNNVTEEQLRALQLPGNVIKGWVNYLQKGGKFKFKEDVQKLYNLSTADYERLAPYFVLPSKTDASQAPTPMTYSGGSRSKATVQVIDINTAETTGWTQLPGIGEGWARKILNWRDNLGGFVSIDQVAEARNLPDSVFQKIKPFLICGTASLARISINTADWQTLNAHPYIESKHARWIIAYREQHGNYRSLDDLLKIPEIKPDWLNKVKPYLSVGLL